ncbi:unnamed protein product, partial [Prunus brigantina]
TTPVSYPQLGFSSYFDPRSTRKKVPPVLCHQHLSSASRRLFVPTPAKHQEYQVYSDCRDRINHQRRERQMSPIHVQAKLNDRHLAVLGPKSPPRRKYAERQGRRTTGSEAQARGGHLPIGPQTVEPFGTDLPHTDPTIRLLLQKINRIEEEQNQTRTPTPGKVEDPVTHIHTFQSALGCKGITDEGQCQLFPSTLAGAALNWFYRLEPGDSEPLREYAARFSHEYSRCPETDDRAAFGAFKSGLRASQFRYLVHSSNWTTYGELMKQAVIHAKAEHFNSKGMPSATGPSATTGAPPAPTYDNFQHRQTTVQAPYQTAPPIPASYAYGDKRRDSFQVGRTARNEARSQ